MNITILGKNGKVKHVSNPRTRFIEKVVLGTKIAKRISTNPDNPIFIIGTFNNQKIYATTLGAALLGCGVPIPISSIKEDEETNNLEYALNYYRDVSWLKEAIPFGYSEIIPLSMKLDSFVCWLDILLYLDAAILRTNTLYKYGEDSWYITTKAKNKRLEVAKILIWLYEGIMDSTREV